MSTTPPFQHGRSIVTVQTEDTVLEDLDWHSAAVVASAYYVEFGERALYDLVWEMEDILTGRTPERLCEQLAGHLVHGAFVVVRHEVPKRTLDAPRTLPLIDPGFVGPGGEEPLRPVRPGGEADASLTFELHDQHGNPLAGEPYVVTLPDGTNKTGILRPDGSIHIADIVAGNCKIAFPRLDKSEWGRAG